MNSRIALLSALAAFLPGSLLAQKAGDSVTPEALGKLDWIRGEAPAEWEPGKLYILECWATWCGPCVAAIPHVDALYDRYHDQGLEVFGINVWENGRDMVAGFVEKKGDGMSYPVAYTGKGGAFETSWLKPGGVTGIPAAFVVKDGRVLLKTHPARLTEEMIEAFLKGGEAEKAALESVNEAERRQTAGREISRALHKAMGARDKAEIKARLAELEKADPESGSLPPLRVMALSACGEWESAQKGYEELADDRTRQTLAYNMLMFAGRTEGMPADFLGLLADDYELTLARTPGNYGWIRLAKTRWELGQKDEALAAAKSALKIVEGAETKRGQYSEPVCRKLVESIEEGTMPDQETLNRWLKGEDVE